MAALEAVLDTRAAVAVAVLAQLVGTQMDLV
jgi:hypothetical protein